MSESFGDTNSGQQKQRRKALEARSQMNGDDRQIASQKIASAVARSSWFSRSRLLACYLSTESEVGTWSVISRAWQMKKRVFAPVVGKKGRMRFHEVTPDSLLVSNRYGLLEPLDGEFLPARSLHIVLTPLAAFDAEQNRIGMGGGYYDRTFAFLKNRRLLFQPKLIGLAFDCQRVEKIAANPWDIRLYSIVTESS